jgi:hypothetical protein
MVGGLRVLTKKFQITSVALGLSVWGPVVIIGNTQWKVGKVHETPSL